MITIDETCKALEGVSDRYPCHVDDFGRIRCTHNELLDTSPLGVLFSEDDRFRNLENVPVEVADVVYNLPGQDPDVREQVYQACNVYERSDDRENIVLAVIGAIILGLSLLLYRF